MIIAQIKDWFLYATVDQRYISPFRIMKEIFLKSQQVKIVKVHELGTKQLDQGKKKRQLGAGGSQDLAQLFSAGGGELEGSSWQQQGDCLKTIGREETHRDVRWRY